MDIYDTHEDPLARIMRKKLRERNVPSLKVVCSDEPPIRDKQQATIGSVAFVPPVAGFILAGEVVKDLIGKRANA